MTYEFLQHYWCFIVALLGALLVFLLFVQGANSMVRSIGQTDEGKRLVINSTGRKWEFTFTTLVTFGGAFFASYPLFYSTSFGGAYWLWMIILFTFVLQAVSYEFQNKLGNFLGANTFHWFLVINGLLGPLLLGGAVATFFEGFGLAVMFLARILGILYIINNVDDKEIRENAHSRLFGQFVCFLILFVAYLVHLLLKDGFAYNDEGVIFMEPYKYLHNFLDMWPLTIILLIGVVLVLYGTVKSGIQKTYTKGIWPAGIGVVLVVLPLLLMSAWNHTAYYPSTADLQSSLTMANSCSSEFTLRTMFYVSLLVPFVLAYIVYAWRAIDKKKLDKQEIIDDHAY